MSNPNGGIEVSPDGISDGTGYSFVWHRGSIASPPSPISGETSRELFLLRRGIYSVEVTNDNTRCRASAQYTVPYREVPLPTPVATVTDITSLFASEWRNFCGFRG